MKGQINRGSKLGELIYELAKQEDVKTILDIGTWNGMGSTKCIYDGLVDSGKQGYLVYSLECNKQRWEEATINLPPLNNFNLIHGSIIDYTEIEGMEKSITDKIVLGYLKEDIEHLKTTPNIFNQLPDKIDLCIIDGGEFSGTIEFFKLWKRCKYLVLDDIKPNKHKKSYGYIIKNPDVFKMIELELNERNGYLICENLNYEKIS